jgi:hypothetical protein
MMSDPAMDADERRVIRAGAGWCEWIVRLLDKRCDVPMCVMRR